MAARLGNAIYWLGFIVTILAGLLATLMAYSWSMHDWRWEDATHSAIFLMATVISFGSWLVGRIALYVLADR
jgi:ABC-type glycerol-3-phosphate transport system permease component